MYELNQIRIQRQTQVLTECVQVLEIVKQSSSVVEAFAVMRALHIAVECVIDIGNSLIDGFIMRDPGGYADIIDILEDERVISPSLANQLKEFVQLREKLVRYYDQITVDQLTPFCIKHHIFIDFIARVTAFLEREREAGTIE